MIEETKGIHCPQKCLCRVLPQVEDVFGGFAQLLRVWLRQTILIWSNILIIKFYNASPRICFLNQTAFGQERKILLSKGIGTR